MGTKTHLKLFHAQWKSSMEKFGEKGNDEKARNDMGKNVEKSRSRRMKRTKQSN